jgi:Iap family predicted aminopeptidase
VPVDGALDNLTGVAMGVEMVKYFSENPLKHTVVRAVSFGAEEPGMRGSEAYADAHYDQLLEEKAFLINIDTTKDVDQIAIVRSELRTMTFFDKAAIEKMEQSFVEENVAVKKVDLLIGNTDAASFELEDLPCISIIGLDNDKLDPTYHTRLDNLDNYNPEASRLVSKVLVSYIQRHDAEMSNL